VSAADDAIDERLLAQNMADQKATEWAYTTDERRNLKREVSDAFSRALMAGARRPLEFKGFGAEGIVFCDDRAHAFKVGRGNRSLENEAGWLETASGIPEIAGHVAKFYRYHPNENVIERECVEPFPLLDVFAKIERVMLKHGWTAPESKDDSFVFSARGPVLVDAGFTHHIGDSR